MAAAARPLAEAPASLSQLTAQPDYARQIADVTQRVGHVSDPVGLQELLEAGARTLGAERAVFISFVHDDLKLSACRLILACDPEWCQHYLAEGGPERDPWLAYAARNSEPVIASNYATDPGHQQVIDLAIRYGFRSTVLAPAHGASGPTRASVLFLGSSQPGFFDDEGYALLRIGARMLALELHEWWLARIRHELVMHAGITPADLELLRYERQGRGSKYIAEALHVSKGSVDSRFQRMNLKLGVANRKIAAQLAAEFGLLAP